MAKNARTALWTLFLVLALACGPIFGQVSSGDKSAVESAVDSVVTILLASDGQANAVGSGIVVRSDGYILTPFHLVRGAYEIQVRLRNGEVYDRAQIVSSDERRNIAIIHVNAAGLRVIPNGTVEETQVGTRIFVAANPSGQSWINKDNLLNSVQLADGIPGAGKGYRLLQFDAITTGNATGALILDEHGRSLGIVTTNPDIKGQNIAVPLSSIVGLIRSISPGYTQTVSSTPPSTPPQKPYSIPQSSVQVPERGVTALAPKGPGSVVVKPRSVPEVLAASKTIFVKSKTVFFQPQLLVSELNKHKEISEWDLSFVDDRDVADLILEIDHIVFTYKFTFKIYSQRLGTIVAAGNAIIFDGNLGAPHMADRVIKTLAKARGDDKKAPAANEKKDPKLKVKEDADAKKKKDSK